MQERSCSSEGIGSLAVGTERGDVAAFDASLGQQLWCLEKGHSGRVCSLYHSKSNAVLYSAGADGIVLELSPSSGSVLHRFKVSKRKLSCMSIQRDGSRMLTGASKLTLWRMGDRKVERKFTGHMQPPHLARFDPSGTFAATASPGESSVVMWDLRTSGETQQSSQGNKKRRQSSSNASSSVGMCESFAVLWLNHPAYGIELSSASPKRNSDTSTKMDVNIAVTSAVGEVYIWTCRPPDKPGGVRKVRLGDGVKETLLFARALGNEGMCKSACLICNVSYCGHLHCTLEAVKRIKGGNLCTAVFGWCFQNSIGSVTQCRANVFSGGCQQVAASRFGA